MAKGRDKHQNYLGALNLLGKELARRSGRKCELSEQSGSLVIHDLESSKVEPDMDHVVLVSSAIKRALEGGTVDAAELRFLENAVWSTVKPVRRAAVCLLERIDEPWAQEAIDNARVMADSNE